MLMIRPYTVNDAALISSDVPEADYTPWNGATTYALGNRVRVVAANVHKVFESLQNANTGHDPLLDKQFDPANPPVWWVEVSSTNKWKVFDQYVNSQTSQADAVNYSVTVTQFIDSLVVLNANAASLRVVQTHPIEGVVYDQTYDLVADNAFDYWEYFFEPVRRIKNFLITDLLPYDNSTLAITLTDTGSTVLCGGLVIGLSFDFGGTQLGARIGTQDYSSKSADTFGNYFIIERAFSKTGSFTIEVEPEQFDFIDELLSQYRATPAIYIGGDIYRATYLWGFPRDFYQTIAYQTLCLCNLEIEGMT